MKKRIVCLTLAILMCGSQVVSVMADRESDLREEQAWTAGCYIRTHECPVGSEAAA